MFFVIFPKEFEYNKFILTLNEKHNVVYCNRINKGELFYDAYIVRVNDSKYMFCCKLINESDVKFLLKFGRFLSQLKQNILDDFKNIKLLIIGTCGVVPLTDKISMC